MPPKSIRLLIVVCAGLAAVSLIAMHVSAAAHQKQQGDEVQEAVFRYQMRHFPLDKYYRVYFLSLETGDPSPMFLRRFGAVPVLPASRMESGIYLGYLALLDKRSGRKGWSLSVNSIHWGLLTDSVVDVGGSVMNIRSGGEINTYHVVRTGGRWRVTGCQVEAIA